MMRPWFAFLRYKKEVGEGWRYKVGGVEYKNQVNVGNWNDVERPAGSDPCVKTEFTEIPSRVRYSRPELPRVILKLGTLSECGPRCPL